MARTLILMRHAKSSWDDPELADLDRPLNARGRASATAIGAWLRDKGHMPHAAVSSNSKRTAETFERLGFDIPVSYTPALYHAGPDMMMEVLRAQTAQTLLMLGHNPGIAEFAYRLVQTSPGHARFDDYPTCATCIICFEGDSWTETGWRSGQPIDFAIPREVIGD